jgi:hypothetical protein
VGGSTVARAAGGGFDDRAFDDRALDASGRRTDVPARRSGVVVPGTP